MLDKSSDLELSQQIYEQIKEAILDGQIKPGERMASSRELAETLGISRPTIGTAYEQLALEGYIEMRHGSGTYVKESLKAHLGAKKRLASPRSHRGRTVSDFRRMAEENAQKAKEQAAEISKPDKFVKPDKIVKLDKANKEISFQYGRPSLDHFPHEKWARIVGRTARDANAEVLTGSDSFDCAGHALLKEAIAESVLKFRGLAVDPEQVIVVNGVNQGLDLAARIHLTPGCVVAAENPGYQFAWQIFRANSARLLPLPLDGEGIVLDGEKNSANSNAAGRALLDKARLFYVTPSHQFPHGVTMSLSRRLELLSLAKRNAAIILEDDFDSEYQSTGKPVPALMSLDKADSVVYSGTFNQLVFPSLNIGYLLVPRSLIGVYREGRRLLGEQGNLQMQLALAEFIKSGELERHWRRMKAIYSENRKVLLASLDKFMPGAYRLDGDQCGVFVRLILRTKYSARELVGRALSKGVRIYSNAEFFADPTGADVPSNEYIIGYGDLTEKQIERGIKLLAEVL